MVRLQSQSCAGSPSRIRRRRKMSRARQQLVSVGPRCLSNKASNRGASLPKPSILIVEDEWLIREVIKKVAEAAGFEVLEAGDADEAIPILEKHRDVQILFTDIDMPGSMNGLRLAQVVRDRWPPVALIVTSGKQQPAAHELPEGGLFLAKPYDFNELKSLLMRLASAPS